MRQAPAALESKLFILESHGDDESEWIEQATGTPSFFKEESHYKLTFRSGVQNMPYSYQILVTDNVSFDRAQSKIITWTVIKENVQAALSFRDQNGANSFWYLIQEYQRKDSVQVQSGTKDHFVIEYKIPNPSRETLPMVLKDLEEIPYIEKRQRISSIFLTKIDLLPALKKLFLILQGQGVERNAKQMGIYFEIMKLMLNFGDCQLITDLLSDNYWKFTLGCLEYDPQFFGFPHRQFMDSKARFLEVVPFKNPDRLKLIHTTYRLEYVKQCVLAHHLDETGLRTHTMIVLANYKDILGFIFNPRQKDYLNQIFNGLRSQDLRVYRLLQEICRVARTIDIFYGSVQDISKDIVFHTLSQKEIYEILFDNLSVYYSGKSNQEKLKSVTKSKAKSFADLTQISRISLDIIINSLDVNPLFLKDFCNSEKQKTLKYPIINFLFKRLNNTSCPQFTQFNKIVAALNDNQVSSPVNPIVQSTSLDLILSGQLNEASSILILDKLCDSNGTQLNARFDQIISRVFSSLFPYTKGKSCLRVTLIQVLKKIVNVFVVSNKKTLMQSLLMNMHFIINILKETRARNCMQLSVILQVLRTLVINGQSQFVRDLIKSISFQKSGTSGKLVRDLEHIVSYKESQEFNIKREASDIILGEQSFQGIDAKKQKPD